MQFLPEDPRLIDYALGEIENKQERKAIESAVAQSAELQAVVASIREMSELLTVGYAAEPAPELSEFEKARMEPALTAPKRSVASRLLSWPMLTSAVAALIVAFVVLPQRSSIKKDFAYQAEPRKDKSESVQRSVTRMRVVDVDDGFDREDAAEDEGMHYNAKAIVVGQSVAGPVVSADAFQPAEGAVNEGKLNWSASLDSAPPPSSPVKRTERILSAPLPTRPGIGGKVGDLSLASSLVPASKSTRQQMLTVVDQSWERPAVFSTTKPQPTRNTEKYAPIEETEFRSPLVAPLSTFSIDVDTASYANVRRFLNQGQLPPADAVRVEELINYFPYSDAAPNESLDEGGNPFAVHMAQTIAPWNQAHHLLRVALKGYEMPWEERPASNLVFLLDVSGSMSRPNKLPLVKEAMDLLVRRLDGRDRVAVVVYAGASGLALPSTTANNRETIQHAMDNLKAGGSTNGGAGIQLAYKVAREHFIEGGNNRVILCTDGDFNVGQTHQGDLADVAEAAADDGVSLTILGFGMGNLKDDMLEALSNKGKGSYAYVDSSAEARKVFLEDLTGNLFKIAKDVKIQVEFNPAQVQAYRLIGYENRRLKAEDFNNDQKKAGDIGPGHTVVALYEIVPTAVDHPLADVDALRYQQSVVAESVPSEVATVKLRYKQPEGSVSQLITRTVDRDDLVGFDAANEDVRFSAIVAAFGMRLTGSAHLNELSYDVIESIAASSLGVDPGGHRSEFVGLVRKAGALSAGDARQAAPDRSGDGSDD